MAELLDRVDSVGDLPVSDRVNATSRSNKDKSEQSFSDTLKKKMKDEGKEPEETKDEVILAADGQPDKEDKDEAEETEPEQKKDEDGEELSDHIDITA